MTPNKKGPDLYSWHKGLNGGLPLPSTVQDSKVRWAIHHHGIKVKCNVSSAVQVGPFLLEVLLAPRLQIFLNNFDE